MTASSTASPGTQSVGRAPDNDIVVDHPSVSAHHCRLVSTNGVTRIQDLSSTNGTWVSGLRVVDHVLQDGDRVTLGLVSLTYLNGKLRKTTEETTFIPSASTLRDLLTTPSFIPAPPHAVPGQRRSRRWLSIAVVALVVLSIGGFAGIRGDQYRRQQEMQTMLELIEESESVMREWSRKMEELADEIERTCGASPAACDALLGDEFRWGQVKGSAREAARALEIIAAQFRTGKGLRIAAWHSDVVRARDSYLEHNKAWVYYLEAVGRNIDELLNDTASDDDIDPTFTVTCRNLRKVKDSPLYPDLSASNKDRVKKICAEEQAAN